MNFSGTTQSNDIEFIMISEASFTGLELFQKIHSQDNDPIYEEVSGFEPLRNIFKTCSSKFLRKIKKSSYSQIK